MVDFARLTVLLTVAGYVAAQQPLYAQCGGTGWTGSTTCVSGAVCTVVNTWYHQCLPGSATTSSTSTTSTTSTTTRQTTTTTSTSTTTSAGPTQTGSIPNMSAEWRAAYVKANTALSKLSLQDKVTLATGIQWQKGQCVGNTAGVSSINFPGLCLQDGPLGIRFADLVSVFPAGINAAATFNRTIMRKRGVQLGEEFRGKGVNVALSPAMNIARVPAAGRNWEGFGGDPYLSGEAAYETIKGIQSQGVQTSAKHYINNEQEHYRETSSSNVDDRTQHEIYLLPFLRSIQANVASVMCSYKYEISPCYDPEDGFLCEPVNSSYACGNDKMLNKVLKGEFGFPGYVMSDWWATHSTQDVNGGLDMTMPGDISLGSGTTYFGSSLVSAVNSGQVSQTRIDDVARRILAAWYLLGQDSGFPTPNFNSWNKNGAGAQHVNVQGNHKDFIRESGAASIVLLKNTNNALPLKAPRTIAVIGNGAGPSSRGINGFEDRGGLDGILAQGWGSGTAEYPYLVAPSEAITNRARQDSSTVTTSLSDDANSAASAASGKEVAIVVIQANSGEGYITVEGNAGDRNNLQAWHNGDALVQRVASVNSRTIVVVNSVGPIVMESWINNANVTAVVWGGLLGQEAGNAITDILYGAYNPSARLPYTIGKSETDYSTRIVTSSSGSIAQIPYNEGLLVDYRHFDQNNIAPRFEFGFGLSYTTFSYASLSVSGSIGSGSAQTGTGASLDPWLHTSVINVSFSLSNTGSVAGHEVPQLYITHPSSAKSPPKSLKGFDSVFLTPGQTKTVTLSLTRFDLAIWDTAGQRWVIPSGQIGISVGASSRNIKLTGSISN